MDSIVDVPIAQIMWTTLNRSKRLGKWPNIVFARHTLIQSTVESKNGATAARLNARKNTVNALIWAFHATNCANAKVVRTWVTVTVQTIQLNNYFAELLHFIFVYLTDERLASDKGDDCLDCARWCPHIVIARHSGNQFLPHNYLLQLQQKITYCAMQV